MKKITLSLFIFSSVVASAQLPVSQVAGKKQAVIEEFTGHKCGYCPDGHKIVDQLIAGNPGKIYGVNIHTGSYATVSSGYTNDFNTTEGAAIAALPGQGIAGYPAGSVNRVPAPSPQQSGGMAMSRGSFGSASAAQYNQNSYVNVAGAANYDPNTKVLTVDMEAYYTASGSGSNKISVMLIQNKIMGAQSGGSTYYPAMMVGSMYTHNKVLRKVISSGSTGEAMAGGTSQGTLYKKTFTYNVPATIKNLAVVIADCEILAFVSETEKTIMAATKFGITTGATGVNEVNTLVSDVNVFPNPAVNTSNVSFNMTEANNVSISLTNMLGQVVMTESLGNLNAGIQNYSLDVTNLNNGLYNMSIITGDSVVTQNVNVSK